MTPPSGRVATVALGMIASHMHEGAAWPSLWAFDDSGCVGNWVEAEQAGTQMVMLTLYLVAQGAM